MNNSDIDRFTSAIGGMARTLNSQADEALFYGYSMGLDDLPIEVIERAVITAMRTCSYMPTVVELRKLSGEVSSADRAIVAWGVFEGAVIQHGSYKSVCFDDPVIHATVRNHGGWERCCQLPESEFDKWLRQDFLKTYTALCSTGISHEAAQPLIGSHEANNRMNGYLDQVKPPLQITTGLPAHKNLRLIGGQPSRPALPAPSTTDLTAGIGEEKSCNSQD